MLQNLLATAIATMAKRAVNVEEAMKIEQNYIFWAIFLFFKMTCLKKVFNYRPCAKTVNVEEAQEVEQNYIFWAISSFFKMTCLDKVFNYRHINAADNCVVGEMLSPHFLTSLTTSYSTAEFTIHWRACVRILSRLARTVVVLLIFRFWSKLIFGIE